MNSDGTELTRLTDNPAFDGYPQWSADARRIAFASDRDGSYEVYVMDASGSGLTRLTDNPATDYNAVWSPDGTQLAFQSHRDGNWEIYVVSATGSGLRNLTNTPDHEQEPAWSPDGTRIAFTSEPEGNSEVYVMNADGSGVTNLTNNPAREYNPDWSPDGTRIAFTSDREGNAEIYVMNADGSGAARLTDDPADDVIATWSPDGTQIAFSSYRDANYEVYAMRADGSGPVNLTDSPHSDRYPDWSPNALTATLPPPATGAPAPTSTPRPTATLDTATSTPTVTRTPEAASTRTRSADGMLMVYVPAGGFTMGDAADGERAEHRVTLDAYWIDSTEVTNAQYGLFIASTGHREPSTCDLGSPTFAEAAMQEHPVVCVNWDDAAAYCLWAGARLPTEAEWEKAARGTEGRVYPWGNTFDGTKLNYCDANCPSPSRDDRFNDGFSRTAPAGHYPAGASPYGALDMAGNVCEWVADWYAAWYYPVSPASNPGGPSTGQDKALRGSGWLIGSGIASSAYRSHYDPAVRHHNIGFRCVKPP